MKQFNESLASKVFLLQQKLEESSLKEIVLIKKLEEAKFGCQNVYSLVSSEKELKKQVDGLLTELKEKNEKNNSLESDIASLMEDHMVRLLSILSINF